MTEDEARDKWCPYARVYHTNGSFNRTDTRSNIGHSRCIASDCAMWRWVHDPLVEFIADGKTIVTQTSDHGYCGLAGKP